MKFDFNIKKNKIELLNCQIDIILKSLEFYAYRTKNITKEENVKSSLISDTYHQILAQYKKKETDFEDNLKEVA